MKEDLRHMLFCCDRASIIWNQLGVTQRVQALGAGDRSGQQMVAKVINDRRKVTRLNNVGFAELILTGCWYIWWERRSYVHGESVQNPGRSAMSIGALTSNYMRAFDKVVSIRKGWMKPPEGKLMINVDASFVDGRGSTGVVIRDSSGGFIAASMSFLPSVLDATMAESYALKEGLCLANQIGCSRFLLHSDCQEVVGIMNNGGFTATASAPILEVCYDLWKDNPLSNIEHCNREANQVAHELARQALDDRNSCIWVDSQPSFITALLANDVTLLSNE